MKKILYISLAAAAITGCQPEFNDPVDEQGFYTNGDADFSNFVSVGNSLTAGYADGALYLNGQQNSFPNMLATQFKHVGGGDFTQPLVNDNLGGLLAGGEEIADNRRVIVIGADGSQTPQILEGTPTTDITNVLEGPFNNMGVPGSKVYHLSLPGYGNIANLSLGAANPYFIRMASSPDVSVIEDAASQNPTFFSLWIGNNDILGYATTGGVGVDQTGNIDPRTYGGNDITDPNVFAASYNTLLEKLTENGAKGVVANIPDVTTIPYFTTVPYNPVPLDEATATSLNTQLIGPLKQILTAFGQGDRVVLLQPGANPLMIKDEDLTDLSAQLNAALQANGIPAQQAALMASLYGQARHATAEDLVTLPTSSLIGTAQAGIPEPFNNVGVTYPLQDESVLIPSEQANIATAQTAYNATIEGLATQYDLAFVDAEALMTQLANGGISFDGGNITNTFATGGAFSLDGVHPTQRGYAVLANNMISVINQKYNATVPSLNPGAYPTIFVE
ncbi:G-D-S-L family lipolytic protein [Joostella atrarenae]|uniref:G-D-S-L family lipolytic protein n=1 Tax=Joostella atrarenae TaxID=679257 RepID=A0ABS9J4N0_9FLAO|nr:G-D-S-L family lipolytic protein [Joostella atrarenae]MCF8715370.1 G-D-S-L family lipolytic protein [Joostella atrarenae]